MHRSLPEMAPSSPVCSVPKFRPVTVSRGVMVYGWPIPVCTLPPEVGVYVFMCGYACVCTHLHSFLSITGSGENFPRGWRCYQRKWADIGHISFCGGCCSWLSRALKSILYQHDLPETKINVSLSCPKSTQDFPANLAQATT